MGSAWERATITLVAIPDALHPFFSLQVCNLGAAAAVFIGDPRTRRCVFGDFMMRFCRKSFVKVARAAAVFEPLEHRCLLSGSPSGFTPAQIAQAYGISAIKFG